MEYQLKTTRKKKQRKVRDYILPNEFQPLLHTGCVLFFNLSILFKI